MYFQFLAEPDKLGFNASSEKNKGEATPPSDKTKQEKDEFLNNVKNICLYNQKLFLEYGKSVNKPLKYNSEMEKMIKFLIGDNLI